MEVDYSDIKNKVLTFDDRLKEAITAKAGIDAFRRFLISIGMPEDLESLGADSDDIPKLVNSLLYGDGGSGKISGFITLDEDSCTKIYKMMV